MRLKELLEQQNVTQLLMGRPMGEGEAAAKENILALIVEASEVLEELNWKPWRVQNKKVDRQQVVYEVVDTMKFLLNIMNELDISAEDFEQAWYEKSTIVNKRIRDDY